MFDFWDIDDVLRVLLFLLCVASLVLTGSVDIEVARRHIHQRVTAFYFRASDELNVDSLIAAKGPPSAAASSSADEEEQELPAPRAIRLPVKRYPSSFNLFGDPSHRRPTARRTSSGLRTASDASSASFHHWLNPGTDAAATNDTTNNVDDSQRTAAAAESDDAAVPQDEATSGFTTAWANFFPLTCMCAFRMPQPAEHACPAG